MTRTMKRKLQEENNIDAKKTNVLYVPLEKQISTPGKSLEDLQSQTPHQIRENEAEKRKELHLKSKADQRYFSVINFYQLLKNIIYLLLISWRTSFNI